MLKNKCQPSAKINTNSRYKNFTQAIYTAGDIDQFNSSRIYESLQKKKCNIEQNIFKQQDVLKTVWFKNCKITSEDVENTFKYLFFKFKKGLFIRISNNKLVSFLPFTNAHYRNEFSDRLIVDPKFQSVQDFLDYISRKTGYVKSKQHLPLNEWVPNNALMRYEYRQFEGDNNIVILNHMFKTLCEQRDLPDIEFFVNRRDFPQIKTNSTEPYNHIYDSSNLPLKSHKYDKYSPILSSSSSKEFADIIMPTFEDWARAHYQETGEVFPNACREYPNIQHVPWEEKISKAVFRGATTGAGFDSKTNQRLLAYELTRSRQDLFDVGFTKWNLRPRKFEGHKYLQTIEMKEYPVLKHMTLQEQSTYKYILNLEGHVSAYRLSYELSSGSVVLLASSKWKMWYSDMIKPYIHYVPVSENLSDLISQVEWCKNNDEKCIEIVKNAQTFYDEYLGKKGILDFLQKEICELSSKVGSYKYFPDLLPWSVEDERKQLEDQLKFTNTEYKFDIPSGPRCIGRLDGLCEVLRSKSITDFKYIKNIMTNANGTIDLVKTNNAWFVAKKANNDAKVLEHIHESYIGLNAINKLVGKIPNFAYVFGPLKDSRDMIFTEYISGVSFHQWLESPDFNIPDYLTILVQLNLAISVAQNFTGFVHYDLYPWNVIIQKTKQKFKFTYFVDIDKVLTIETNVIPIIIDYGKSRAVIFEKNYGLIDHGFTNLYKPLRIIDSLTLMYSSLNIIRKAHPESFSSVRRLTRFSFDIGLEHPNDIKFNSQFGSMFESRIFAKNNLKPIHFIDFIVASYPSIFDGVLLNSRRYTERAYTTEKGNAIQTSLQMFYGDNNNALIGVIEHINKSRPPMTTDAVLQRVLSNILERRLEWLDNEMNEGSVFVKTKWLKLREIFNYQPTPTTDQMSINYPKPYTIYTSGFMSPEYVKEHIKKNAKDIKKNVKEHILDDWKKIWILYVEAFLFGVIDKSGAIGDFIKIDGFEYLNAIASNNVLSKIQKMIY